MYYPARGAKTGKRERMAGVRLFKYWYIALNAINVSVEKPIVVTM
jgi:hypothetical protein